jgi:hypothetical protein
MDAGFLCNFFLASKLDPGNWFLQAHFNPISQENLSTFGSTDMLNRSIHLNNIPRPLKGYRPQVDSLQ